jgi:DNA-binding response OmpR family regulator
LQNTKPSILIAEDDPHLGLLLSEYLRANEFDVVLCADGESAVKTCENKHFDICLLDVMMPKMDGFEAAKHIKTFKSNLPFIFITARNQKLDKLNGYAIGAEDYINKPFDEEELLWKIRAILRRNTAQPGIADVSKIQLGNYSFDTKNLSLVINNVTKRITEKECEVLLFLVQNKNTVVKRSELLQAVWGDDDYFIGRSLDVFIAKIRKYLKEDPNIQIETVFGVGFILNVAP